MSGHKIGFIGAGNMAQAMISGWMKAGYDPATIYVSNRHTDKLEKLNAQFGIQTTTNNQDVYHHADILIFAVKPNVYPILAQEFQTWHLENQVADPLIISIAAGLKSIQLQNMFHRHRLVRVMPNTPVAINQGMLALLTNTQLTTDDQQQLQIHMSALGQTVWLENENLFDSFTATAGSGPAYFFFLLDAMTQSACTLGFTPEQAQKIILQTALGSVMLAEHSQASLSVLIKQVRSKGGTTDQGLAILEKHQTRQILLETLQATYQRAQEITQEL